MSIEDIIYAVPHFSYSELLECINVLSRKKINIGSIGKSVLGKDIYILKIGKGPYKIHMNASMHANEWITTPIILQFISDLFNLPYYDELCSKISLDIVPMINPDGVDLVCNKIHSDIHEYSNLLFLNRYNRDFSDWKSNINGVDLNRNFPANFWRYKSTISYQNNTDFPSPKYYSGELPLSEPETKCLAKLCRYRNYDLVAALHTQGQVIYYTYNGNAPIKSVKIAKFLSKISGYELEEPEPDSSYAGFKDWFIQDFNKPGFTFELGKGENPLNYNEFTSLYKEAYPLLLNTLFSYEK
jgi:g-D-glutamyl-meso-diaminopimelate peptidase